LKARLFSSFYDFLSTLANKLSSIRVYLQSEVDAVPLCLILASSPLPPLVTLRLLKKEGYEYLPEYPIDTKELKNIGPKLKRVLEAAKESQKYGSRTPLLQELDALLSECKSSLELADYTISQFYQLLSVFTSIIPSIIVSVVVFTNPSVVSNMLYGLSAMSIIVSFVGAVLYPPEIKLRSCLSLKSLAPSISVPFLLALAMANTSVHLSLLLSVALGSVPACVIFTKRLREEVNKFSKALTLIERAASCPLNIFQCLGIDDPRILISNEWGSLKPPLLALYLLALYGGEASGEGLRVLLRYFRSLYEAFKSLRRKGRIMLFYSMIEACMAAAIYGVTLAMLDFFSTFSLSFPEVLLYPVTRTEISKLMKVIDVVLTVNCAALAIGTANAREGDFAYAFLYLPALAAAAWIAFNFSYVSIKTLMLIR